MFAKLYETEFGQVLVKIDRGTLTEPEVRFYFKPEGLGVCSVAVQYLDDDDGWDKAEAFFVSTDEQSATVIVKRILDDMPEKLKN